MISTARWIPQEGVAKVASILGQEHVRLRGDSVVAAPGDLEQIAAVLQFAQKNGLAVMATGGGTKLGWGHPVTPAIELSLERMRRLREHAWEDMTCSVEAGLRWQTLQAELAHHGQMVALDPLWPEQATVGGIVAANDSGALRFKYGGLRDLVLGMTLVLADGTVARTGGKVVKNVAGYDLHKLMTGSFGTLAVIAEVNFRLHPLNAHAQTWTVSSSDAGADASVFSEPLRALRDSHLTPSSVQIRVSNQACAVDVRIAGASAHLQQYAGRTREIFSGCEVSESSEGVWGARQLLFEKNDRVVVKISALPNNVCSICGELQQGKDVSIVAQAHGIVTTAIPQADAQACIERLRKRLSESAGSVVVLRLPEALCGSIDIWGPAPRAFPLMQEIKRRFDPFRVLNPGRFGGNLLMSTQRGVPDITANGSGFDTHHPPEKKYIDDCVHCGFCLPACPTYVLWGEEMDSPRGRIYMIKSASEGRASLDDRFQLHMDNCLGCMACMTACPSGVQYNKLIEPTRAQIERRLPRGLSASLFRRLLFATVPHPRRLRLLALPLFIYHESGLRSLVHATGVHKLLPKQLAAMEALLPEVPRQFFRRSPAKFQPGSTPRRRVGMLSGCVQQVFFSHVNAATARVLAAEGCEVIVPPAQECCGALMLHSGLESEATSLAKKMIAVFEAARVDTVVINSAGCGSTMKEYGYLLRDDSTWAGRAAAFSAKCRDISEILCELEPQTPRHPLKLRVAYHDACHLQHAQGLREQPRQVLASIPELEVVEIPESSLCCGSAGVYNLLQPEPASHLGSRKVDNLLTTGAEAVISANPGCLLQLMKGLRERGAKKMPAFHMVELLDASQRGTSVGELLKQRYRDSRIGGTNRS